MWRGSNGSNAVGALRNEVDRLFGDFFGPAGATAAAAARVFPAVNVWEKDDAMFVEAEVPGLKGDDLDISVVGSHLVIKGRRADFDEQGVSYHRRERGVGDFSRTIELPADVEGDAVQAKLTDGVLQLALPKAEAAKPRRVQVKS